MEYWQCIGPQAHRHDTQHSKHCSINSFESRVNEWSSLGGGLSLELGPQLENCQSNAPSHIKLGAARKTTQFPRHILIYKFLWQGCFECKTYECGQRYIEQTAAKTAKTINYFLLSTETLSPKRRWSLMQLITKYIIICLLELAI